MALDEYNLEENNFPDNPYSEDYDVDEAYDDD